MLELIGGKTLQEIQDMPMSERHKHMRKYVSKDWGRDTATNRGEKKWHVDVTLFTEDTECFEIWAINEDNARNDAIDYINKQFCYDDFEITSLVRET